MKSIIKKLSLIAIAATLFWGIGSVKAYAASAKPGFVEPKTVSIWMYEDAEPTGYSIQNIKKTDKVKTSISDKSVAEICKTEYYGDKLWIFINPKKEGFCKITCTVKRGKKTYKSYKNLYVVKYTNPFKSFKVGKNDYASMFATYSKMEGLSASSKSKVAIKLKKGFKLENIYLYDENGNYTIYKNNKTINMKKYNRICVGVLSTKNSSIRLFLNLAKAR